MTPAPHRPTEFVTTQWDKVLAAAEDAQHPSQFEKGSGALEELCSIYRGPIVEFCRHQLNRREDAEDTAQMFLSELVQGRILLNADEKKGRFRNLILKALKHFVFDLRDREKAAKRGGNLEFISLSDLVTADKPVPLPFEASADLLFDRDWAAALCETARRQLQQQQRDPELSKHLVPFLGNEFSDTHAPSVAASTNLSVAALRVRLHRLRQEFGEILRREVAKTVSAPHEIEAELSHLKEIAIRFDILV